MSNDRLVDKAKYMFTILCKYAVKGHEVLTYNDLVSYVQETESLSS